METIIIGADHAGYELKQFLVKYLKTLGHKVVDVGASRYDPKDDYPDYAAKAGRKVRPGKSRAILVCGSAQGICMAANKIKGVRAVAVGNVKYAKLSRVHNDSNVLCISGWELSLMQAKKIVKAWIDTEFSGEKRHIRRIKKISRLEK